MNPVLFLNFKIMLSLYICFFNNNRDSPPIFRFFVYLLIDWKFKIFKLQNIIHLTYFIFINNAETCETYEKIGSNLNKILERILNKRNLANALANFGDI